MLASLRLSAKATVPHSQYPKLSATHVRRLVSTAASPSVGGTGDPFAYCEDFVRKHDYDSFIVSQSWPREKRKGYFALKAFAVRPIPTASATYLADMIAQDELAMVQDSVSNPVIGKMRMQFWRDAVKGMSDVRMLR